MKLFLFFISLFSGLFTLNMSANADVYSSTTLLAARSMVNEQVQKTIEQRRLVTSVLQAALDSTAVLQPQVVGSSVSGQSAQLMYKKRKLFTGNSSFSCAPSGEKSGSGIQSLTFVNKTVVGEVGISQAAKDVQGYEGILANELFNMEASLFDSILPSYIITNVLEANKSTVNLADGKPNNFNIDTMEVNATDVKRFYNLLRSDMQLNNYDRATQLLCISSGGFDALHASFGFGGISNLVDTTALANIKTYESNDLTLGAYSSVHYIVPAGGMYFVTRIPDRFLKPQPRGTYERMRYNSLLMPGVELVLTRFMSCADESDNGGVVADDVDKFELGIEFATGVLDMSVAGEHPDYKYGTLAI